MTLRTFPNFKIAMAILVDDIWKIGLRHVKEHEKSRLNRVWHQIFKKRVISTQQSFEKVAYLQISLLGRQLLLQGLSKNCLPKRGFENPEVIATRRLVGLPKPPSRKPIFLTVSAVKIAYLARRFESMKLFQSSVASK